MPTPTDMPTGGSPIGTRRQCSTTSTSPGKNKKVLNFEFLILLSFFFLLRDKMLGDMMMPVVSGGNFIHSNGGGGDSAVDGFKYPHLQVNGSTISLKKIFIFNSNIPAPQRLLRFPRRRPTVGGGHFRGEGRGPGGYHGYKT